MSNEIVWQNRIVGHGDADPSDLLANPFNYKLHGLFQQNAVEGSLEEVGWIDEVTVNKTTGHVVDGHLRITLAMRREGQLVPVRYVELSEEEERKALAVLDPLVALATTDGEMLQELLQDITTANPALEQLLDELSEDATTTQLARVNPGDGSRNLGDRESLVKLALYMPQVGMLERALRNTGVPNRGEALMLVCESYLGEDGEEGQLNDPLEDIIADQSA